MACRHAHDHRVVDRIVCDNGARTDECVRTDRGAAHDGAIRAEGCTFAHKCFAEFVLAFDLAARVDDVGEYDGRANENIVFQLDSLVNRHVILDLHAPSDAHAAPYENVLTEHRVVADVCVIHHMGVMPDA